MAMKKLDLDTLGLLDDGRAKAIIERAFAEAIADLEDRGMDGHKREVQIKINLEQVTEDSYSIEVQAGTKRPGWKTAAHTAKARKQRGEATLVFQEFDREEPDQSRIEDIDK
jgi:hypothetical protein